jgi:hypothetical protein
MTSATARPAGGHRAGRTGGRGQGLIAFSCILLAILGIFNLIYGIAALAHAHVIVANAHYVVGDVRSWGWVTLIFSVLLFLASAGVQRGSQLARWFAVVVLSLNAIDQMFFIPAYPFWSLTIIAVDVVALYGLCVYGSRDNVIRFG